LTAIYANPVAQMGALNELGLQRRTSVDDISSMRTDDAGYELMISIYLLYLFNFCLTVYFNFNLIGLKNS